MRIGVVLVTFNRLNELQKTIRLYEKQTKLPEYILVVDNHSTDGTTEFLENWAKEDGPVQHKLITLPQNMGGSGGFYAGTEAASEMDAEWIWLADDDGYPQNNALEELEKFSESHPDIMSKTVALCTENLGEHGIATGHRVRVKKILGSAVLVPVSEKEYHKEYFSLDVYSFVGAMVNKNALLKAGFPQKEFFIYADDTEHALRMGKLGDILCVPAAKVYHYDNYVFSREASWRDYYVTRNLLLTLKWHCGYPACFFRLICRMLTAFRSRNVEKIKVVWVGICDAQKGKIGIHPLYRPGWQPKKKFSK